MKTTLLLREATAGRIGLLVVVTLVAFGLKRHYADAPTDALWWILTPTATLVGLVTGATFTAVPGEGYLSVERLFLIEKACAGVNFMIASFAMVTFTLFHRVRSLRDGATVLGVSLAASYVAAVVVNAVRIVIAMWLAHHPVTGSALMAADVHRLEGITVYFGGLLLLYAMVRHIDQLATPKRRRREGWVLRYALPLGCYYLVTLAVPVANGAHRQAGNVFLAHALLVLVLPVVLLLLVCAIHQGTRSLGRTLRKV